MVALADKLKSLGVQVGARHMPSPSRADVLPVEAIAPGRLQETPAGWAYCIENRYSPDHVYGHTPLAMPASLEAIAAWAGERRILDSPPESFYFLDIETTGLQGGAGVYVFLAGVGHFDGAGFHLVQFFMRDLSEEPAHLLALEGFLSPGEVLVTFNGKAFDTPLLNARYALQGWKSPLYPLAQLDLLPLARRLWRMRFPSRTLGVLEYEILGAQRTEQDVPGWMIPQLYFDYLRSGDARPLARVLYHNAMDVLAMAALLNHMAHLLADPLHGSAPHRLDQAAIGRLFEDLGRNEEAVQLYLNSLQEGLPSEAESATRRRLAALLKQRGDWAGAVKWWQQAARQDDLLQNLYAFEELAKYYEHICHDPAEALRWTDAALNRLLQPAVSYFERARWQSELEHRARRLRAKLASIS